MSVTRKIVDGAKSGLSSLIDKVSADDTPLSGVHGPELDAELARRTAAAKTTPLGRPQDNPRAKWAGAGDSAARMRKKAADEREARIRGEREARRKAEKAASDDAFRRMKEQASSYDFGSFSSGGYAGSSPGGSSSRGSSQPPPGSRRGPGIGRKNDKLAKHYKTLDLPYGAGFDQVKASYRKLMRKYHPDLHGASPQKQKAATELTMQVTQAYNELEQYLTKK